MARWQATKPFRRAAQTVAGSWERKPFCFLMKPQRFSRANWAASRPPCPSQTAKKATERLELPLGGREGGSGDCEVAALAAAAALELPPPLPRQLSVVAVSSTAVTREPPISSGSTRIWVTSSIYFLPPWSENMLTPSEHRRPSMRDVAGTSRWKQQGSSQSIFPSSFFCRGPGRRLLNSSRAGLSDLLLLRPSILVSFAPILAGALLFMSV